MNNQLNSLESSIEFPHQSKQSIEDFHDFVAERMAEPVQGITDLFAMITPATERARMSKIMNIKVGGDSTTRRSTLARRGTKRDP